MTKTTMGNHDVETPLGQPDIVLTEHAKSVFEELEEITLRSARALKQVPIVDSEAVNRLAEAMDHEPGMEEDGSLEYLAEAGQDLIKALTLPQNPSQEILAERAREGFLALRGWDLQIEITAHDRMGLSESLRTLNELTLAAFIPLSIYLDPEEWEAFKTERNTTIGDIDADERARQDDQRFAKQRLSPSGS